jgi:hypothetical protein
MCWRPSASKASGTFAGHGATLKLTAPRIKGKYTLSVSLGGARLLTRSITVR